MITVERLVERFEDLVAAVEQLEIEVRGQREHLERLADAADDWLNANNGEPDPPTVERSFD